MKYGQMLLDHLPVKIQFSEFNPGKGVKEIHAVIELTDPFSKVAEQYKFMDDAVDFLMQTEDLKNCTPVWKRYFVSDAINQATFIISSDNEAISVIQQPPLNGTKVAVWLYWVEEAFITEDEDGLKVMKRPTYTHLLHTQLHERKGSVGEQTDLVFKNYTQSLAGKNASLEANCVRTWIYVQDVDVQYMGMVNARKIHFEKEGLTSETHYIASTGIEGRYLYPEVLMLMDAYAIPELKPEQITFLYAPTHLNSTYEYGVTFERGVAIDYGDRRQIFISGTASINNKGEIMYPLDIDRQTDRTIENVNVLLQEAGATMSDVAQMIVYLRDTADYPLVVRYMDAHYPEIPRVIVLAPVCRPGWLIEVECIALVNSEMQMFNSF